MSGVDSIGLRVIEPYTSSDRPSDAVLIREAQGLLNTIAGTERFPLDGELGAETVAALERFQESHDLPASGALDRPTLVALHREAARAARAREGGPEEIVAPQVRETDMCEPPVVVSPEAAADTLRARLGNPGIGEGPSPARDGWRVERTNDDDIVRVRWIGLTRRDPVRGIELAVTPALARLGTPAGSAHVAAAIRAVRASGGSAVDRSLLVAIASRETGALAFSTSAHAHNPYTTGGLDFLMSVLPELHVPEAVRSRITPAPLDADSVNEHGRRTAEGMIEGRDVMTVYAGYVDHAERRVLEAARAVFHDDARADAFVASMTVDERRAWTQLAFGRAFGRTYEGTEATYDDDFGLRTALGRAMALSDDPGAIFTDPWMGEFDGVRRARVTTAEAALIDQFGGE